MEEQLELKPIDPKDCDIIIKVKSKKKIKIKVPGWEIKKTTQKTTLKKKKGKKVIIKKLKNPIYFTYYQGHSNVNGFVSTFRDIQKQWIKMDIGKEREVFSDLDKFDDPRIYPYEMRVLSSSEFEFEINGWVMVEEARRVKGLHEYSTVYRSKSNDWDEFMLEVKEDVGLRNIVERMAPGITPPDPMTVDIKMTISKKVEKKRRINITVTVGGGSRKTQYEYPHNCTNKKDRQKFRREQRKKGKDA